MQDAYLYIIEAHDGGLRKIQIEVQAKTEEEALAAAKARATRVAYQTKHILRLPENQYGVLERMIDVLGEIADAIRAHG